MAKYYGEIGYAEMKEIRPGVWEEQIIKRMHYGEYHRNIRRLQPSGQVNDNITISNEISIVADPYTEPNFHSMRYAEFMGAKYKIDNVEVSSPKLILTLGGLYNGK